MTEKQKLISPQHRKRLTKEYPHYVDCKSARSFIGDINEQALFADGFDNAIIGYDANGFCVVYDYDKCLKVLIERDDMSYPEAHEYMEFNVVCSFVGEFTPIFIHSLT
jgi:hypothetical protein